MVTLRSPRSTLDGYIILPRLIDKVRLNAQDKLPPDYVANLLKPGSTLDGRFLTFTGLQAEELRAAILASSTDDAVLAWVERYGRPCSDEEKQHWAEEVATSRPTPEWAERRKQIYPEVAKRIDVAAVSVLDLIDMDEGRMAVEGSG